MSRVAIPSTRRQQSARLLGGSAYDPTTGLTPTAAVSWGNTMDWQAYRYADVTIAANVVVGASPDGLVIEQGGAVSCFGLGVASGSLRMSVGTQSAGNYLQAAISAGTRQIVAAVRVSDGMCCLWIDGVVVASGLLALYVGTEWAGTNLGGYGVIGGGSVGSQIPSGTPTDITGSSDAVLYAAQLPTEFPA